MPAGVHASACSPAPETQNTLKRGLQRDDVKRTATVERIPDPKSFDLEAAHQWTGTTVFCPNRFV